MAKPTKADELIRFYTQTLNAMNVVPDEEGRLSMIAVDEDDEQRIPVECNGKRMVLPYRPYLVAGNWDNLIPFHPLSENLLRGESEVIRSLRTMVTFRISAIASQLLTVLMGIAADPEAQAELTSKQIPYLKEVPHANEKTVKVLNRLLARHFNQFFKLYLRRSGTYNGEEYRRVAAVSFPIWDELSSSGTKIYDVECGSAKNKRTIAALFEVVFPDVDNQDAWSYGSNSDVAPYFQALMGCLAKVGSHLNGMVHLYRKYLDNAKSLKVSTDWLDDLEDLSKWKHAIPALPGNLGATSKGETEDETVGAAVEAPQKPVAKPVASRSAFVPPTASAASQNFSAPTETTQPQPQAVARPMQQPVAPQDVPPWEVQPHTPPPAPTTPSGKLDWSATMAARPSYQPGHVPGQVPVAPPVFQGGRQPMQYQQQPMQYQQPYQQQPHYQQQQPMQYQQPYQQQQQQPGRFSPRGGTL